MENEEKGEGEIYHGGHRGENGKDSAQVSERQRYVLHFIAGWQWRDVFILPTQNLKPKT
jgi:hypothetical protein